MTRPASARAALAPQEPPATPLVPRAAPSRLPRQAAVSNPNLPDAVLPEMTPVQSSNIHSIGHDGAALYVRFHNGSVYRYPTAGRDLHAHLLAAKSVGSAFQDRVRHFHNGERIA